MADFERHIMIFEEIYYFARNVAFFFEIGGLFLMEGVFFLFHQKYPIFVKNVVYKLTKKNVLYTKIFQSVALNKYFVDDVINEEILKYTDSVPYSDEDIDYEALYILKNYLDIDLYDIPKPINAGMISLVYKMSLNKHFRDDHERLGLPSPEVIVKIKRKNIVSNLSDGMSKVKFFGWMCSFIPLLNLLHIPTIIDKLVDSLNEQLDFKNEVKNMLETKKVFAPMDYIRIPAASEEIVKNCDVIVMEYLNGTSIKNIPKEEYEIYGKMIIKYAFASFIHGIVHGDLHSGNILFMRDQIGIIDFGLMTKIKEEITLNIANIFPEIFSKSGQHLAKKIFVNLVEHDENFQSLDEKDIDEMCAIGGVLIEDFRNNKKTFCESVSEIILFLNKCIQSKKGKINEDYAKLQVAFAMTHGLSIHLFNDNYISCMNDVMNELFHYNLFSE